MCYIESSLDHDQIGYIGDNPVDLRLALFVDADFAGCRGTMKSTTGVYLALVGPNSHYPLGFLSKKHSACAHSTVEAELIAADTGVRLEGIPAMGLWRILLGRKVKLTLYEDNQASGKIMKSGKYPTFRHVGRVHAVNISILNQ